MTVASALDLMWALAALSVLGMHVASERRRRARLLQRLRRTCAVFMAAVALFPCISASDDFVRFGQMLPGSGTATQVQAVVPNGSSGEHGPLARLLQVLDSFQISAGPELLTTLCVCPHIAATVKSGPHRIAPSPSSRAPPSIGLLS